ncbi:MAG: DUF998 domain-containing protein [Cellvibrionaceae bacterium]
MFIVFGVYVLSVSEKIIPNSMVGMMIILHGLGTWVAGYFPMDKDPYTNSPSFRCKIHFWAGLAMLLSLLIAPALICTSSIYPTWFRIFSVVCILGNIIFTLILLKAYKAKSKIGFHQRLSYGFQILWILVFSFVVKNGYR